MVAPLSLLAEAFGDVEEKLPWTRQAVREGCMEHETWMGLGRRFGISLGNEQKDRFHNAPNTRMTGRDPCLSTLVSILHQASWLR